MTPTQQARRNAALRRRNPEPLVRFPVERIWTPEEAAAIQAFEDYFVKGSGNVVHAPRGTMGAIS